MKKQDEQLYDKIGGVRILKPIIRKPKAVGTAPKLGGQTKRGYKVIARPPKLPEDKSGPCWSGYVQVGMKKKNGRTVPNCVPRESVTNEDIASATTTASIPDPAVTSMGPRYKTTNMTDRRYKKKGLPVLLKRFRKYIADNQNGSF